MPPRPSATSSLPTLFLERPPEGGEAEGPGAGGRLVLEGEEARHARALRLRAGDPCLGVDGRGARWFLEVVSLRGGRLELEAEGPPERDPAPGEAGAPLPWVELAVAWPRKNRAAAMIGTLVQLGCAAITSLDARYRGAEPSPDLDAPRWRRLAREAMKQCGRTWVPRLGGPIRPESLADRAEHAAIAMLHPRAGMSFDTWLRSLPPLPQGPGGLGTPERPILLLIGPEGGFDAAERETLLEVGASAVWLGPHVMRIETAACAAMALAGCALGSPSQSRRD